MEIKDMTDKETSEHLRRYVDSPDMGRPFSWPTDACGYDQHIKFVNHRNQNWAKELAKGKSFREFILEYADMLDRL